MSQFIDLEANEKRNDSSTTSTKEKKTYIQGRYWLLTVPEEKFTPHLPKECCYIIGQLEEGKERQHQPNCDSNYESGGGQAGTGKCNCNAQGYRHWQMVVCFNKKVRPSTVIKTFGKYHHELTRSDAAEKYCEKNDTFIEGTRFEFGKKPMNRNSGKDWANIRKLAVEGKLDEIDDQVFVCHYGSLKKIALDHIKAQPGEREIIVYWGETEAGKSTRAWAEAGWDAYPKDPNTKTWDAYRGEPNVVMEEFRGKIDISHVLRWFDKFPVIADVKYSACALRHKKMWITSNLHPKDWYPELDEETKNALLRRLTICKMSKLKKFDDRHCDDKGKRKMDVTSTSYDLFVESELKKLKSE